MAVTSSTVNLPLSGSILTSAGSNGSSYTTAWTNPYNANPVLTIPQGEDKVIIDEKATLEVKGTVVINGVDLEERLSVIETVLCIPQRDVTMEVKYPKLKALYEEYMKELEKYKTWERVKGSYE